MYINEVVKIFTNRKFNSSVQRKAICETILKHLSAEVMRPDMTVGRLIYLKRAGRSSIIRSLTLCT